MKYEIITIGVSWGGMKALQYLLPLLPSGFRIPIVVVQHLGSYSGTEWVEILNTLCKVRVKEADEKEKVEHGVYIAPANYHLLVESDKSFSLSLDERVNFARPSIDVFFECVADVYGEKAIGVVLTGLNYDGAKGLKRIKKNGGLAVVQDPNDAEIGEMPSAAIAATEVDYIVTLEQLVPLFKRLEKKQV